MAWISLQDLLDAGLVGDRLVEDELDVGHAPQPQALSELPPHERRDALQGAFACSRAPQVAERRVVDARELQVRRDRARG